MNSTLKKYTYNYETNIETAFLIIVMSNFFVPIMSEIIRIEQINTMKDLIAFMQTVKYDYHENIEAVRTPIRLVEQLIGDCDDKANFIYNWCLVNANKPCECGVFLYKNNKDKDFTHINNAFYNSQSKTFEIVDMTYPESINQFKDNYDQKTLIKTKRQLQIDINQILKGKTYEEQLNEELMSNYSLNIFRFLIDRGLINYYFDIWWNYEATF